MSFIAKRILHILLLFLFFCFFCCSQSNNNIKTEPYFEKIYFEEVSERELTKSIDFSISTENKITQTGIASWYGGEFHGRRTANGEIYNMYRLTAAHQTLPFNTIVEVENVKNQKKVIVRINDRGPFVKNRIIDLSLKAAQILGIADKGTVQVNIRIIKSVDIISNGRVYNSEKKYYLQAGAFQKKENALRLLEKLKNFENEIKFYIYIKDGYFKIISDKIADRQKAERFKRVLNDYGIDVFIKNFD